MADIIVMASGNGTNFQNLSEKLPQHGHRVVALICDRKQAYVIERAKTLKIPYHYVSYYKRHKSHAEDEMLALFDHYYPSLIALAGFMRILSPKVLDSYPKKIINIHPSLLPKYPGKDAIEKSYYSGDKVLGITIHYIDYGMDTGPIISQYSIKRQKLDSFQEVEEKIRTLEYEYYPKVISDVLNADQTEEVQR